MNKSNNKWQDVTSYSQSGKECIPSAWSLENDSVKITVTNGHIHYKDEWVMHCDALRLNAYSLNIASTEPKEKAQALAIDVVRAVAREILESVKEL